MNGAILGAALVPGLPHILFHETSPAWGKLNQAMQVLAAQIKEKKPDVLVVYSTQWLSVLGTSFQAQKNPKGVHVDENWYELGDLPFDFEVDSGLSTEFAETVLRRGFPTKTVNYEEFPIDTGTIVALEYLREAKIPVSIVSSWVYADATASTEIGSAMRESLLRSGRKAFFIASSLLSTRFFTQEIDPKTDKVSQAADDEWNQKLLGAFEKGDLGLAANLACEFAKAVPTDMQLNAVHWLRGVLEAGAGQVLAYGPLWGTGAAVVHFHRE